MKVRVKEALDFAGDRCFRVQVQYIPFTPWFNRGMRYEETKAILMARALKYPLIREII